jgi:hypothetical protein
MTLKQILIFVLAFFLITSCKNDKDTTPAPGIQPAFFTFNGQIGTLDNSTFISIDSNLIICGNTGDNISILKITMSGAQVWRKDFGAGSGSVASGIVASGSNELFICGKTYRNYSTNRGDVLLIKTTSGGDTIWTKTYGGSDDEYGTNIIATSDGNLLVSGKTESFGAGSSGDLYLIKVNTNGDTLWTRSYPDEGQEIPFHLLETQNGEYLVTGVNEDNTNPNELYLLKVSAGGGKVWNKKIGPATWKWGFSTIELSNGDLLTCGKHTTNGYSQVLLVKTDNLGNVIWEKEFGDSHLSEQGNSIKQNADGTFIITGFSFDAAYGQTSIILLKVDQSGNQLWLKMFGGPEGGALNLIKDANDDNIITGNYNESIFMTRTDNNGNYK